MPGPSTFARKLATIAESQHAKFQFTNEADPALCKQIQKWTQDIGFGFTSCTDVPWSAVFVLWCVKEAGATAAEFKFAMAHSVFVHKAIKDAEKGTGVFHVLEITAHAPAVGDIIQNNRNGSTSTSRSREPTRSINPTRRSWSKSGRTPRVSSP